MHDNDLTAYLAPHGYADILKEELIRHRIRIIDSREELVLAQGAAPGFRPIWAQNIWQAPVFIPIASIGDAVKKLCGIQRNWYLTSTGSHRRAALIAGRLPHVSAKPLHFGDPVPSAPLGSWTLWDQDTLLASPDCSSPFPDGVVTFHEDKVNPPSRAYLKLWEAFTRFPDFRPKAGDLCLDMGASPGGWTWVLANLGAHVFAIDKAPLAKNIREMANVESCLGSGFGMDPRHAGKVDFFFSDMICYPARLYEVVSRWMELGECQAFVCTIKCQGQTDHALLERFQAFPNSHIVHLSCNKHEVTWLCRP